MKIGIPREIKDNEFRVAMTPSGVRALTLAGHTVDVEKGAGEGSGILDETFRDAGAAILSTAGEIYGRADVIVKVKEPLPSEYPHLREGQILFTFLHLAANLPLTQALMDRGVTAIAYETVAEEGGTLPILTPMSEVAGRMSVILGAQYLQRPHGGSGILLGGVPGVSPGRVLILGSGVVAQNAARMAVGLGAQVVMLCPWIGPLRHLDDLYQGRVMTVAMNEQNLEEEIRQADLVIGAVLVPGAKAPRLITRAMIRRMKKGSLIVDISIDQGGCAETSRPTTHSDPVYEVDGVLHYCVANIPGIVPRTSTFALSNATLPYVRRLADMGASEAFKEDPGFLKGVNVHRGRVTSRPVAASHGLPYEPWAT
jgi:alanine dehydrogenase